jgi:outer membrane phospholipase A
VRRGGVIPSPNVWTRPDVYELENLAVDPDGAIERAMVGIGFTRVPLAIRWKFARSADLEAVVQIEFAAELAEQILRDNDSLEVDYAVNLWWRRA